MNTKQLIEYLQQFPDDTEIVLQKDAEGNGYSPLAGADHGYYVPDSTWSGDFYDKNWDASDCGMDDEYWENIYNGPSTIVLFPVN
jgi:hypothetical protein